MKNRSQLAHEQGSDAQNWQEGDRNIRFKIPSFKKPRHIKEEVVDKKANRASCPIALQPRLRLPWILSVCPLWLQLVPERSPPALPPAAQSVSQSTERNQPDSVPGSLGLGFEAGL